MKKYTVSMLKTHRDNPTGFPHLVTTPHEDEARKVFQDILMTNGVTDTARSRFLSVTVPVNSNYIFSVGDHTKIMVDFLYG